METSTLSVVIFHSCVSDYQRVSMDWFLWENPDTENPSFFTIKYGAFLWIFPSSDSNDNRPGPAHRQPRSSAFLLMRPELSWDRHHATSTTSTSHDDQMSCPSPNRTTHRWFTNDNYLWLPVHQIIQIAQCTPLITIQYQWKNKIDWGRCPATKTSMEPWKIKKLQYDVVIYAICFMKSVEFMLI